MEPDRTSRRTDRADRLGRLIGVLAWLDAAPRSVTDLVNAVPELVCELGFDRAMISRVENGVWHSRLTFCANGVSGRADEFAPRGLVGEGRPLLVTGDRPYVAAPLVSQGQVVGMLHADCRTSARPLGTVDRDVLAAFAVGLQMTLSGAVLHEQLLGTQLLVAQLSTEVRMTAGALDLVPAGPTAREAPPARRSPAGGGRLPGTLTAREREVLGLMADGCTNTAIARRLMIADGTAKKHVFRVLRKLGVSNRSEAVACWFRAGEDARQPAVP